MVYVMHPFGSTGPGRDKSDKPLLLTGSRDEKGLGGRGSSASEPRKQKDYFGLYISWSQVIVYHFQRPHRCLNDTCLPR